MNREETDVYYNEMINEVSWISAGQFNKAVNEILKDYYVKKETEKCDSFLMHPAAVYGKTCIYCGKEKREH